MRGFHFSLRWLFGVVSFMAVGCGLLVYATPLLSQLTFMAAVAVLLTGAVDAACNSGERRMYWVGFAVFGLAYIWLVCGSWQSPDGNVMLRDRLVTTALLQWCHERTPHTQTTTVIAQPPAGGMMMSMAAGMGRSMPAGAPGMSGSMSSGPGMMGGMMGTMSGAPPTTMTIAEAPDWGNFSMTGHALIALAFAVLGGLIATRFYRQAKSVGM
jgi:hypothetical protein